MKAPLLALASILALAAVFSISQADTPSSPQLTLHEEDCTEKMQAECALDLERTAKNCAKAFASEGTGIISDIKCLKDLKADKAKCWPCLCEEAKEKGWHNLDC